MALEPLGSDHFYESMARLKAAGANELYAIKAERWMDKSAAMLEVVPTEVTIGYADKLTDPIEQLNFSLIAKIQSGVADEVIADYTRDITALPGMSKDRDYCTLTNGLMRSAHMFKEVTTRFPGLHESWSKFFVDRRKGVFEGFADMVPEDQVTRKKLFEALASVVSGAVPASLDEYKEHLELAHEQFYSGESEALADTIYGISALILDTPPPGPPPEGEPEGGGNDDEDESSGGAPSAGGGEDEDDEDAFGALGDHLSKGDVNSAPPTDLKAEEAVQTPKPEGLDIEKIQELQELQADVVFPEADTSAGYLTFTTMRPPGVELAYAANVRVMAGQIARLRQIVEEYYRTTTITETGLKSGRPDAGRMHRLNYGVTNVFKRHTVDSVGHAEVIVLLDESGSMGSGMHGSARDKMDIKEANYEGIPKHFFGGPDEAFLGRKIPNSYHSRASVAMRMALMLLEVSRQLSGFHVQVAGYSDVSGSELGPMREAAKSIAGSGYHGGGGPVVRLTGTTEHPYPIVTTVPMSENADYQALHWAVEKLKKSNASQRAILYLADGQIWENADEFDKLMKLAQRQGTTLFFMNLSGGEPPRGSMLAQVDRQDVSSFADMVAGLKRFLTKMAVNAS